MASSMNTSTIVTISIGTVVTGLLAYAIYFDYRRHNDASFRKNLKRESRRQARLQKEESLQQGQKQKEEIRSLVREAVEEGFPTDLEEREAYFMQQIAQGEQLAGEGSDPIAAALCFYKGLKVYPEPTSLIGIYENTVPKEVQEILAVMVSQDKSLKVGSFGADKDDSDGHVE
ncbi:Mitochondrial import receptor subunit tom20 [Cyphellophora attinorum]|uniref:Mitochondrial import receptor subunit TOM20 n=1 Tax=Cyphellophora attinorum TaxID=1664694 RepID=A0A0N0NKY9_9EURO|nr:Mitochondrial import receptor subunit tom20 [Phialophora attinorum]KPI38409.1 Mitochondrial import receptor subunit tom20 [Phialophora attinorum]